MMNPLNVPKRLAPLLLASFLSVGFFAVCSSTPTLGQDDAVYRIREGGGTSRLGGKISKVTPIAVTVETSTGAKEVSASEIDKLTFGGEPLEVSRARDRMEAGRFDDALATLEEITEPLKPQLLQQEVEFLKAYSTAQVSLMSGAISARDAGKLMSAFISNNQNSYHLYPAIEMFAKLSFAVGAVDFAEKEFAKMTQSKWPEMILRGHFYRGEALNLLGKHDEAKQQFEAILASPNTDDMTQQYKLLAKSQIAKTMALTGQQAAAIPLLNEIIKVENPDNSELFAYTYNALGTCHLKAGNLNEAALAFLHTELLFAGEAEPHAEALYQLALLWPQLEQTDRASRAREGLKSRYRNSYWASKL